MKRLELEKKLNEMDLDLDFFYHEEENQLDILIDGDEDVLFNFLKENCNVIYSNPWKNSTKDGKLIDVNKTVKRYDFIKGVFTVYTASYAIKNNVFINCGGRKCIECLNCYNYHENVFYINEILKSDSKKYYEAIAGGKR